MRAERLGASLGMTRLYVKDESQNPTQSFKARGMTAAVSMAKELGVRKLAVPSAGNAAGALAAYAARAGMEAHIFMPRDTPRANVVECEQTGAHVTLLDGLITDCGAEVGRRKEAEGWFDVSTLKEPYRVEGKKTLGYELAEQMGWTLPDVVVYPTGGGTGLIGMWKAFDEMEEMGWIGPERPRMVTVQAAGCAPIVRAFEEGKRFADEFPNAATTASGLRVPKAVGDFLILDALRASGGDGNRRHRRRVDRGGERDRRGGRLVRRARGRGLPARAEKARRARRGGQGRERGALQHGRGREVSGELRRLKRAAARPPSELTGRAPSASGDTSKYVGAHTSSAWLNDT